MLNHPKLAPWPFYEPDEIAAASQTLISGQVNYWTGSSGKQFEAEYARTVGKKYGIALSNGTVALELALRVMNIQPGDEVIVTSRSYVASASCVLLLGAKPIFADIDYESGNISVESVEELITNKTKAIIPVHVGGWPCDMKSIMALAQKFNLKVIEDCAQAHGAAIEGKQVGSWGHAAIFSFCQDKIISTGGEGGMLLLDDNAEYKQAWAYKDIGRNYDAVFEREHPVGFRWLTESAGSNFRMTEFQSAIGLLQLKKLPYWIERRNAHANKIIEVLKTYRFIDAPVYQSGVNAYYRCYAKIQSEFSATVINNMSLRDFLINEFEKALVPCFSGACSEIYREKLFKSSDLSPKFRLKNAAYFSDNAFCFLVHHTITDEQIGNMISAIGNVLAKTEKIITNK